MMEPKIMDIQDRKLVGLRIQTALSENKTLALWQSFKPRVKEIGHKTNTHFYSVQIYGTGVAMEAFTPHTLFEKWAAVEVDTFDHVPDGLEKYILSGGKYAVFIHRGPPNAFYKTAEYIFGTWMRNAEYELDERAHFEIMGAQYRLDDPNSEEEIWVPIKVKSKTQHLNNNEE